MELTLYVAIAVAVFAAFYSYVLEKVKSFRKLTFWGKWGVVVAGNAVIAAALVLDACYTQLLSVLFKEMFGQALSCPENPAATGVAVFILALGASQTFHNLYNRRKTLPPVTD